ncbi:MAG: hypothetical protein Ct9H300mP32_2120 [Verrucomicrobiota bacterium]|nr:MAG: hypothetical protein Ct9H300mP32_2120 [Verrucomicrobiota bacterium]
MYLFDLDPNGLIYHQGVRQQKLPTTGRPGWRQYFGVRLNQGPGVGGLKLLD